MGAPVHIVRENGDCAWWCNACRDERQARKAALDNHECGEGCPPASSCRTPPCIDTSHRDAPVCPKCGREQIAHIHRHPRDGVAFEVFCPRCQAMMRVTVHVTVTYSTIEVKS